MEVLGPDEERDEYRDDEDDELGVEEEMDDRKGKGKEREVEGDELEEEEDEEEQVVVKQEQGVKRKRTVVVDEDEDELSEEIPLAMVASGSTLPSTSEVAKTSTATTSSKQAHLKKKRRIISETLDRPPRNTGNSSLVSTDAPAAVVPMDTNPDPAPVEDLFFPDPEDEDEVDVKMEIPEEVMPTPVAPPIAKVKQHRPIWERNISTEAGSSGSIRPQVTTKVVASNGSTSANIAATTANAPTSATTPAVKAAPKVTFASSTMTITPESTVGENTSTASTPNPSIAKPPISTSTSSIPDIPKSAVAPEPIIVNDDDEPTAKYEQRLVKAWGADWQKYDWLGGFPNQVMLLKFIKKLCGLARVESDPVKAVGLLKAEREKRLASGDKGASVTVWTMPADIGNAINAVKGKRNADGGSSVEDVVMDVDGSSPSETQARRSSEVDEDVVMVNGSGNGNATERSDFVIDKTSRSFHDFATRICDG